MHDTIAKSMEDQFDKKKKKKKEIILNRQDGACLRQTTCLIDKRVVEVISF